MVQHILKSFQLQYMFIYYIFFFNIIFVTINTPLHLPKSIVKSYRPHFVGDYSTLIFQSPQYVLITEKPPLFHLYFHMREHYKIVESKI